MSGTGRDAIECGALRLAMEQRRSLTPEEQAHVEACSECLEAWLDSTVTRSLNARPSVEISADFAARVAAGLPQIYNSEPEKRFEQEHPRRWGLITAIVLVAAGMIVMAVAHPPGINTWMGMTFLVLVVSEIAGIALWLGARSR